MKAGRQFSHPAYAPDMCTAGSCRNPSHWLSYHLSHTSQVENEYHVVLEWNMLLGTFIVHYQHEHFLVLRVMQSKRGYTNMADPRAILGLW